MTDDDTSPGAGQIGRNSGTSKAGKGIPPEVAEAIELQVRDLLSRYPTRSMRSREVAKLLFFNFGLYPSAQLVRQFTRQGSFSDISSDLAAFWAEVREKSKMRVQGVGLPDDVLDAAGELIQQFWALAQKKAALQLDGDRLQSNRQVEEARSRATDLMRQLGTLSDDNNRLKTELTAALGNVAQVREELSAERQARTAAERATHDAKALADREARERTAAEQRFTAELQSERESRSQTEKRLAGEIRFAKMQIEEARATSRELQEQFRFQREDRQLQETQFSVRFNAVREELGATKLELAEIHGRNKRLTEENDRLMSQLESILKQYRDGNPEGILHHTLQSEFINHPTAFEIADLADASLEITQLGDGSGVRLSITEDGTPRAITPAFGSLAELEAFCTLHEERYTDVFDSSEAADVPSRWFWEK